MKDLIFSFRFSPLDAALCSTYQLSENKIRSVEDKGSFYQKENKTLLENQTNYCLDIKICHKGSCQGSILQHFRDLWAQSNKTLKHMSSAGGLRNFSLTYLNLCKCQ